MQNHGGVRPASPAGPSEALPPTDRPVSSRSPTRRRQELGHNLAGGAGSHCPGYGFRGPVTATASCVGAQLFLLKALPHTTLFPQGQGLRLPELPRCPQPPGRGPATNRSSEQMLRVDQTRARGPGATPTTGSLSCPWVRTALTSALKRVLPHTQSSLDATSLQEPKCESVSCSAVSDSFRPHGP